MYAWPVLRERYFRHVSVKEWLGWFLPVSLGAVFITRQGLVGEKQGIQITWNRNTFSSDRCDHSFKGECSETLKKLWCVLWWIRECLLSEGKGTRMPRAQSKQSKFSSDAHYASASLVTHSICKGFWCRRHNNLGMWPRPELRWHSQKKCSSVTAGWPACSQKDFIKKYISCSLFFLLRETSLFLIV